MKIELDIGQTTQHYGNYRIEVEQDIDAGNPRTEYDNLTVMAMKHRRYQLGDDGLSINMNHYYDWDEVREALIKAYDPAVIQPVYMYDHSGITIATTPFGCHWDSGLIGFVLIPRERVYREYNVKRISKKLRGTLTKVLQGEVTEYDHYLTGQCYGFSATHVGSGDEIGSCWGFYGMDHKASGLLDHVLDDIETDITLRRRARIKQIKTWVRNRVPLSVRWDTVQLAQ